MKLLRPMRRKQSGQAMPMALVLLALGAMIIVPTLVLTTTNLTATRVVDAKTRDIYAADAGVEDGLWKVKYNYLPFGMMGEWRETTYATYEQNPYIYTLYDNDDTNDIVAVNDRNVDVEIKPIWVLETLETPSAQQGSPGKGYGRTPDDRLLIFGGLNGDGDYEISIFSDGTIAPLLIQRIGCWLPPGFHYDENGVCNLEGGSYSYVFNKSPYNGGEKLTWDFSTPINYNNLPAQGSKRIVTFEFTPSGDPTDAFSWTRTTNDTVKLSWDCSNKIFEVESTAPSDSAPAQQTTIVAHSVKKEFQALGSAITGDYQATGNTLIRDTGHDNLRDRLYKETWTNIPPTTVPPTNAIPDDAAVEKIFLYWSGWKCLPWNPTEAALAGLPVAKKVNEVALTVKVGENELTRTKVTASETQVVRNTDAGDPHGWSYSCFADVTSLVTDYFKTHDVPFYGNAKYTVGHWDISPTRVDATYRYQLCNWKEPHNNECTAPPTVYYARYPLGSPRTGAEHHYSWSQGWHWDEYTYENQGGQDNWAYVAWSVVVIYSSPSTAGHHLYIYDKFDYCDHDETMEFTIKGFLAPPEVASDPAAARITCFVGEGDDWLEGDNLLLNGHRLNGRAGDTINPVDNVWNSMSNVLGGTPTDNGIDIDTFTIGGNENIILPWDTEANVDIPTGEDVWNLIYIVLSFRSTTTTGGMIDYSIK